MDGCSRQNPAYRPAAEGPRASGVPLMLTPSPARALYDSRMGQREKADRLLELHRGETPLLLANAWDAGSARLLEWLGFDAIATTSSGHAATLGRLDGEVT